MDADLSLEAEKNENEKKNKKTKMTKRENGTYRGKVVYPAGHGVGVGTSVMQIEY